jgi:hypothetical protein
MLVYPWSLQHRHRLRRQDAPRSECAVARARSKVDDNYITQRCESPAAWA